jgi:hypothetical protein
MRVQMLKQGFGTRPLVLAAGLIAAICALPVSAAPHPRGPVIKVIRPSLNSFPDRAQFEVQGAVGIDFIAASVWAGQKVDQPMGAVAIQQTRPSRQQEWYEMQAEQDARFGTFH